MNTYQLYRSYQREHLALSNNLAEVKRQIAELESQLTESGEDGRQKLEERLTDLRQQETDLKKRSLAAARGMTKFSPVQIT